MAILCERDAHANVSAYGSLLDLVFGRPVLTFPAHAWQRLFAASMFMSTSNFGRCSVISLTPQNDGGFMVSVRFGASCKRAKHPGSSRPTQKHSVCGIRDGCNHGFLFELIATIMMNIPHSNETNL